MESTTLVPVLDEMKRTRYEVPSLDETDEPRQQQQQHFILFCTSVNIYKYKKELE